MTAPHAWERGTDANTIGLLRQYLPQGQSMTQLTQHDCQWLAARKRPGFRTPEECYLP